MAGATSLEVEDVSFAYARQVAVLDGVSATFEGGKITVLLGNNGSGKTTLLRILAAIASPDSGRVLFDGCPLTRGSIPDYKRMIGFMPELLQMYPEARVADLLGFFCALKRIDESAVPKTLERVGLAARARTRVNTLSKGMKQRLNLAQAILGRPKVVILDEPTNGFDYASVTSFYPILRGLAREGAIVILSNHQLAELRGNVDRIVLMAQGRITKARASDRDALPGEPETWLEEQALRDFLEVAT